MENRATLDKEISDRTMIAAGLDAAGDLRLNSEARHMMVELCQRLHSRIVEAHMAHDPPPHTRDEGAWFHLAIGVFIGLVIGLGIAAFYGMQ
jgi:hypothetical protein